MYQPWKRWMAMGMSLCVALSLLVMPAQAAEIQKTQTETETPAVESQETTTAPTAPAEEENQAAETETTEPPQEEAQPSQPEEETPAEEVPQEDPADRPDGETNRSIPALRQDHPAYIDGFTDQTFLPDQQLTRAQAAKIVYCLLEDPDSGTGDCSYTDVPSNQWYAKPVRALCALGLLQNDTYFRPNDNMTRAEFVTLLLRLHEPVTGTVTFPDVPSTHWAAKAISAAATLGWIDGYPDGTFQPQKGLTRAEACTIINRMCGRTGDANQASLIMGLGLFRDMTASHWSAVYVAEASVPHWFAGAGNSEVWYGVDLTKMTFASGIHTVGGDLYYVDRYGKLAMDQQVGAYWAGPDGVLTQTAASYRMPSVPYISQIDNIYAWVGCEAVSTLMGLKAKGYAGNVGVKYFLDNLPRSQSDPEKGFVGSPYVPDPTKKTRTTIYPAKLAEYSNSYCGGDVVCEDFRGASITDLQRELLAGNCVVGYMTLWWKTPYYRTYSIEGKPQRLVSNNHAVLVCGYDPQKGYFISDPYNYYNRGEVHQYWENAKTFEAIWNERKTGMVIR